MSTARHFVVEDPAIRAAMDRHAEARKTVAALRAQKLIEEMGFQDYSEDGFGFGTVQAVLAADGRTRSSYGKGWRTAGPKNPGWMYPSSEEHKTLLHETLKAPTFEEPGAMVMARVVAQIPKDVYESRRFEASGTRWHSPFKGSLEPGAMYWITGARLECWVEHIGGELGEGHETVDYVVSIPDQDLPYNEIPGLREIRHWQFLQLVDQAKTLSEKRRSAVVA